MQLSLPKVITQFPPQQWTVTIPYHSSATDPLAGVTAHSCQFCKEVVVPTQGSATYIFPWMAVCEASFNGCRLFRTHLELGCKLLSRRSPEWRPSALRITSLVGYPNTLPGEGEIRFEWLNKGGHHIHNEENSLVRRLFSSPSKFRSCFLLFFRITRRQGNYPGS